MYVRSLHKNGSFSSAVATGEDYPALMDRCFSNREADVAGFIRRHIPQVADLFSCRAVCSPGNSSFGDKTLSPRVENEELTTDELLRIQANINETYAKIVANRKDIFADFGNSVLTCSAIAVLTPVLKDKLPTSDFLDELRQANPNLTGWPAWLDSRYFRSKDEQPFVYDDAWHHLIFQEGELFSHFEYARFDPNGVFFLKRVLQDDLTDKVPRGTSFDPFLFTYRVAEMVAVAVAFRQKLDLGTLRELNFGITVRGLRGRKINAWADFSNFGIGHGNAVQDEVFSQSLIPYDTPIRGISTYVHELTSKVFSVFEGFSLTAETTNRLVQKLLDRKL
ncbi:MAG: hypothetical protein WCO04_16425 [Pseudomonadota bacterium]